ncbi:ATP-binding cassette domain-containing protein [Salinisphaera sp.]|uniref:ATP-binding cassette domain-containing protein n=1 Tax=Salinisphaera sp. TaxID=1914330 RepID=UPI002D771D98|nr:ATP-binding cassette domain-containing protein [Salinisphaera sp.]HET7315771.1 ATP-binding cassette domain-containing protein [Salinisphaera sp.]
MSNSAAAIEPADGLRITSETSASGPVVIRLSNISKFYADVAALADVDVEFNAGEVHAILGENGAGKSTLMNVISGALQPDQGDIEFDGRPVAPLSPESAAALGIAISFQHPAVLDDLSVLENLQVALPRAVFEGRADRDVATEILSSVELDVSLQARGDSLTIAEKHLLEIAKALAIEPRVLILDEPTASLDQDATEMLFGRIREVVAKGTSVIYITHRLAELRQIARRVTVLRDGRVRGGAIVDEVDDETLLSLIVGRELGSTFPAKPTVRSESVNLHVDSISGKGFSKVSFEARPGQIIGVAGVAGNGQSDLMRALAGLHSFQGQVYLNGRLLDHRKLCREVAFMPSDRHAEGLAAGLSIRENAALSALSSFSVGGLLSRRREMDRVSSTFDSLAVKAPGVEAPVSSLSGGNQQKIVMARALLSAPGLVIADEPTQGVDVGARAEIYRILREVSEAGTPVVVNSSDAAELEGLCDQVIVMSRGRVVATLTGDEVVENRIVGAAVNADAHVDNNGPATKKIQRRAQGIKRFVDSDNAPAVPLTMVIVALALFVFSQNAYYLSAFNITNILTLATALGFIALGQTIALLLSGIDLSVGPLAGLLVVVASFFVNEGQPPGMMIAGFALMFGVAFLVGAFNGCLIRFANFTPIAATLAMYIGLQGCSFLLRAGPGGYIDSGVVAIISSKIGPIPVAFIVLVAVAVAAEYLLRRVRSGWQLRATGSNEESARRIGVHIDRTFVAGYIGTALLTTFGAVMLMALIGVGDPQQGVNYTLSSITAVVLGGTSLRGGRGSFITTLLGALLLTEVLNAVTFLGLSQTYQYAFQGALVLIAAFVYTAARQRSA